jgi:hypothetical protein
VCANMAHLSNQPSIVAHALADINLNRQATPTSITADKSTAEPNVPFLGFSLFN